MFANIFERSYRGNIPKYFIFQILYQFMLFLPVWVIFLQQERGLSLTMVTLVDVSFWLTTALTEIPTGVVADTLGRKLSVMISVLITTIAVFMFSMATSFAWLMVANSLWALAMTFESGAGLALLYDSLRELGEEERYPKIRANLSIAVIISVAVSTLLGGVVGSWHLQATFYISGILVLISGLFVLSLKEPPYEPDPETGERIKFQQALRVVGTALKASPNLRLTMFFRSFMMLGITLVSVTFIQPHAVNIGIPLSLIGVFLFLPRAVRLLGATMVEPAEKKFGLRRLLWMTTVMVSAGILVVGLIPSWVGIVLFALPGLLISIISPLTETMMMRYTPGTVRATVFSVDALIFQGILSVIEPGFGMVGQTWGLPPMFIVMGIGTLVALVIIMLRWRKVWEEDKADIIVNT